jgi:hypothetical protein
MPHGSTHAAPIEALEDPATGGVVLAEDFAIAGVLLD